MPVPRPAPLVFDRVLIRRRLARAAAGGGEHFLLARAAAELADRLSVVTRSFVEVLDLGSPRPQIAETISAMLPHARLTRLAPARETVGSGRWATLVGDDEALPFSPQSFDLAVSALALHAVDDLPGALLQIRHVLKPDGLFLGCLFGGRTLNELRASLSIAESEISGGASPRVAPFSDLRDLGGLLQRAGFALPVADVEPIVVRYKHPLGLFSDLRAMGATNALALRHRGPLRRDVLQRAVDVYTERFADPDGRLRATFEIVWLSGWAPHGSQQKPLKPGSAQASLADALAQARAPDDL